MSRKEKSIELLNKAVADELLAVHQYMYFHFRCDDMGYDLLSGLFKRTAIQEMMHVEQLSERILFLKGEVEMKTSGDVQKIHEPKEMHELATAMEEGSVNDYNAGLKNVLPMRMPYPRNYSKRLLPKKKFTKISMKQNWTTWRNSEPITWPCNLLNAVKAWPWEPLPRENK